MISQTSRAALLSTKRSPKASKTRLSPICDITFEHDLDCPISDMLSVWYTSLKNYPLLIKLSRLAQDLNREVHLPQPPRSGGYVTQ
ncbi:hypothetical protein ABIA06_005481 [Bradyrhizobium yuanmingense]